jgi:hypothetical protein
MKDHLLEAYKHTDYFFLSPEGEKIRITIDQNNESFRRFLEKKKISTWAYITAVNPFSLNLAEQENKKLMDDLREALNEYKIFEGEGCGRDGNWPPEQSYFIAGIPEGEAIQIGRQFLQNAILTGVADGKAQLQVLFDGYEVSLDKDNLQIRLKGIIRGSSG